MGNAAPRTEEEFKAQEERDYKYCQLKCLEQHRNHPETQFTVCSTTGRDYMSPCLLYCDTEYKDECIRVEHGGECDPGSTNEAEGVK